MAMNTYKPMNIMNIRQSRVTDKNQSFAVSQCKLLINFCDGSKYKRAKSSKSWRTSNESKR